MDPARFDGLARILSSRRTALGGLLAGGLAALLGLAPEAAAAHNPIAACERLRTPRKRRRCRRRARAHARTCHPEPLARTCRGRCGTFRNRCGTRVFCRCLDGRVCLANGSCALACADCPRPCDCAYNNPPTHEWVCTERTERSVCDGGFRSCTTTADCPFGEVCQQTYGCGITPYAWWCFPLCEE